MLGLFLLVPRRCRSHAMAQVRPYWKGRAGLCSSAIERCQNTIIGPIMSCARVVPLCSTEMSHSCHGTRKTFLEGQGRAMFKCHRKMSEYYFRSSYDLCWGCSSSFHRDIAHMSWHKEELPGKAGQGYVQMPLRNVKMLLSVLF